MIQYLHPPGIHTRALAKRDLLSSPQGGSVALDPALFSLWEFSHGRELMDIIKAYEDENTTPEFVRAALACLCEAGLLGRTGLVDSRKDTSPQVIIKPQQSAISVIIVNYNSTDWLEDCLASLNEQTFTPFEIIIIDNGSAEDPKNWVKENFPGVIYQRIDQAESLAAALNRGVALASGEYFLLLNPDTWLEPDTLEKMLFIAQDNPTSAAVAPMLKFSWAQPFLNGLGNFAGAISWGEDIALGHLDLGQFEDISELPSACFASVLIPRIAWEAIGPLDEDFPLYYEDIEWSYRARLFGYQVLAAPQAVVYHAFGRRVHDGRNNDLSPSKLANVTYGRLRFATKIFLGWRSIGFKLSYALDDLIRACLRILVGEFDIIRAYASGWVHFWRTRNQIHQQKASFRYKRVSDDRELLALQKNLPDPFIWRGLPELTWDLVVSHYSHLIQTGKTKSLPEFDSPRPKFVIISNELIDKKMAGPGMRYLEMARALGDEVEITLAIPGETTLEGQGISLIVYDETRPEDFRNLIEAHDIALVTAFTLNKFPFISQVSTRLVVDLYDPFIFENLFYYLDEPLEMQADINRQSIDLLNHLASLGDFFICGSERQRDLWVGLLLANQRVNPYTFKQDPTLRRLVDVVGIGFPDRDPIQRPFLRSTRPEFSEDCRIVLWGGGVWDWLDPLTLLQAWPQVIDKHPEARLVILGTRHPNPDVPPHRVVSKIEKLAETIGEKNHTVFFIEWLSYADREALLSEADIGVTLHTLHVETHFSIRTRVLDYIWAGLPILVSEGDVTSEWVDDYGLGRVVRPQDPDEVADAIIDLLAVSKSSWSPQFNRIRDQFHWSEVVEPVRQYCLNRSPSADHQSLRRLGVRKARLPIWRSRLARAQYIWRNQGGRALMLRISKNIRKFLSNLL